MRMILIRFYFFILSFIAITHAHLAEENLLKYLLDEKRYNKLLKPTIQQTHIYFDLVLAQLISVVSCSKISFIFKTYFFINKSEREQYMTTKTWLKHNWQDGRLSWNISLYDGIECIQLPAESIWLPDIVLDNK